MNRNDYEKIVKAYSKLSLKKELSYKQIQNILKHIASDIQENDIIAFYDSTLSNNGKEGTLIAKDAIYCDYKKAKVPFSGLKKIKIVKRGKASINALFTYENGHKITCFLTTGFEIDSFINIIKKIAAQYNTKEMTQEPLQTEKKEEAKQEDDKALKLYYQAKELFGAKKYEEAFPIFLESANLGDEYSADFVGYMYERGLGVTQNDSEAFKWYMISAKKGHVPSIRAIGDCYYKGIGVNKDIKLAIEWLEKSDLNNDAYSSYNLGYIYERDYKNPSKAFEYYKKAANRNHKIALYIVGDIYLEQSDIDNALIYLNKSAEQNYHLAYFDLAKIYRDGLGNTPKDINKAIDYLKKAAELKFDYAYCSLAEVYLYALQDIETAIHYAMIGKEKGVDYADTVLEKIENKKQEQATKKQQAASVKQNEPAKKEIKQETKQQTVSKEPLNKKQTSQNQMIVDIRVKGLCELCQLCTFNICMMDAIRFQDGVPVIDQDLCIYCGVCVKGCPYGFLKINN